MKSKEARSDGSEVEMAYVDGSRKEGQQEQNQTRWSDHLTFANDLGDGFVIGGQGCLLCGKGMDGKQNRQVAKSIPSSQSTTNQQICSVDGQRFIGRTDVEECTGEFLTKLSNNNNGAAAVAQLSINEEA